jgi:hypothetical protein
MNIISRFFNILEYYFFSRKFIEIDDRMKKTKYIYYSVNWEDCHHNLFLDFFFYFPSFGRQENLCEIIN